MPGGKLSPFYRNLALWLVISLMMILLFNLFNQPRASQEKVIFSDFLTALEKGEVKEVTIQGHNIYGRYANQKEFRTFAPNYPDLIRALTDKNVRITAKPEEDSPWYMTMLISWFPMLLLIAFWIFFMRQMQAGGTKAMSFGKAKVKLMGEKQQKVTFLDVAGIEESKEELQEIIEFLRDPKKFT
ncbi:MAG TPA: ATP-dependent metallopeptidase FtsH/Yme1/Tma family protein, partial [Thermodesulfobacteriota bacterium]|nr:ATP-dependent metallopeptidase FtsH/Yme1/Tma family protein [Thermodesulfobacteriota bacterium]